MEFNTLVQIDLKSSQLFGMDQRQKNFTTICARVYSVFAIVYLYATRILKVL